MNVSALPRPGRAHVALWGLLLSLGSSACGDEKPAPPPAIALDSDDDVRAEDALAVYDDVQRPEYNVLLISLDSVRRDYVSCYGYEPPFAKQEKTTPNLDALAAEGVLFENYYANSPLALQAHVSMMTGEPDLVHGVDTELTAVHDSLPTLASVLQKVGYKTAGYYSCPDLEPQSGLGRGFDEYRGCYADKLAELIATRSQQQAEVDAARQQGKGVPAMVPRTIRRLNNQIDTLANLSSRAEDVTNSAIATIEKAQGASQPWFVFAHYYEPHYDYLPPQEYAKRFDPSYQGKVNGRRYLQNPAVGVQSKDPNPLRRKRVASDRDLQHIEALYAAEIAWTDHQVGRLLDELRSKKWLDKTLVVVTSDHGCEFLEHESIGNGADLFEEELRVPLVMRLPGVLPAGKKVQGLASHPDLMPTILEVLGLPVPAGLASSSAAGLIDGSQSADDRYVIARLVQNHPRSRFGGPPIIRHTVQEAFYQWPIKVMRWRRWPEAMSGLAMDRVDSVEKRAETERQKDFLLTWTDVEKHPGEAFEERQKDFDKDPRAAAALERFQQVYADLLTRQKPIFPAMEPAALAVARKQPGFDKLMAERRAKYQLTPPGE